MVFDVAPAAYDAFMGRYSEPLAPKLADHAGVHPGQRALDVGCGTGALTGALVERLGPASVTAVDPSPSFVDAVRARHPGVDVHEARAESLPFAPATFDVALAQLVVHFMENPVAGLREMARVVRPGGIVGGCVWDYGADRGPLGIFWAAARTLDPGVADERGLPGTSEGQLEALLVRAGLRDVRTAVLTVHRVHPSFDEWWEPFTRGVGPAGAYVASLDDDARARLREACMRRFPIGPFRMAASAWAATGRA